MFVFFVFASNFFILNMFVTALISSFNHQTYKKYHFDDLDNLSMNWLTMQKLMAQVNLEPVATEPTNIVRKWIFKLVHHNLFDFMVSLFVGINMLVLCGEYYGAPYWYRSMLEHFNLFFVIIFAIEAVLKDIAVGPKFYFT